MSMFLCHKCDGLRDSDDGCKEGPRFSLICSDCMDEEPDEPAPRGEFSPAQQAIIDAITADEGDGDTDEAEGLATFDERA